MDNPIYERKGYYTDGKYDWGKITFTLEDADYNQSTYIFTSPLKQMDNIVGSMRAFCPKDTSYDMQYLFNQECTLKVYKGAVSGYMIEIITAFKTSPWATIICADWSNKEEYI